MPKKRHIKPTKVPTKKPKNLWKGTLYVAAFTGSIEYPMWNEPCAWKSGNFAVGLVLPQDILMALGEVHVNKSPYETQTYHRFYHLREQKNVWLRWEKQLFVQLKGVVDQVSKMKS